MFRSQHATIEYVDRVATEVRNCLEAKKCCSAVFLDVSHALYRVWIDGLIYKISQYLPGQYIEIIESYFTDHLFEVQFGKVSSDIKPIAAGAPQGKRTWPTLIFAVQRRRTDLPKHLFRHLC